MGRERYFFNCCSRRPPSHSPARSGSGVRESPAAENRRFRAFRYIAHLRHVGPTRSAAPASDDEEESASAPLAVSAVRQIIKPHLSADLLAELEPETVGSSLRTTTTSIFATSRSSFACRAVSGGERGASGGKVSRRISGEGRSRSRGSQYTTSSTTLTNFACSMTPAPTMIRGRGIRCGEGPSAASFRRTRKQFSDGCRPKRADQWRADRARPARVARTVLRDDSSTLASTAPSGRPGQGRALPARHPLSMGSKQRRRALPFGGRGQAHSGRRGPGGCVSPQEVVLLQPDLFARLRRGRFRRG